MQYDKAAWEKMGNSFTNNYEIGITDFRQNIIDTVIKLQPECSNLLDVACADGWFIEQLRKFGFNKNYLGVDITPNLIGRAKNRMPNETFTLGDAMELGQLADNDFDIVMCVGILMHIPDFRRAIMQACRVSKKYVMFSTYGTYMESYDVHDEKNSFLNFFYNLNDILTSVPPTFQLMEFKSFKRQNFDHMFQYLFKRAE